MRKLIFKFLAAFVFVALAASVTPASAACSALEASGGGGSFEAGYGQRGYGRAPPANCLGPRAGYQRGGAFYPPRRNIRRGHSSGVRGGEVMVSRYHNRETTRTYLGTEKVYRGELLVPRGGGQDIFIPAR